MPPLDKFEQAEAERAAASIVHNGTEIGSSLPVCVVVGTHDLPLIAPDGVPKHYGAPTSP